eukprot:Pgem_evm1s13067
MLCVDTEIENKKSSPPISPRHTFGFFEGFDNMKNKDIDGNTNNINTVNKIFNNEECSRNNHNNNNNIKEEDNKGEVFIQKQQLKEFEIKQAQISCDKEIALKIFKEEQKQIEIEQKQICEDELLAKAIQDSSSAEDEEFVFVEDKEEIPNTEEKEPEQNNNNNNNTTTTTTTTTTSPISGSSSPCFLAFSSLCETKTGLVEYATTNVKNISILPGNNCCENNDKEDKLEEKKLSSPSLKTTPTIENNSRNGNDFEYVFVKENEKKSAETLPPKVQQLKTHNNFLQVSHEQQYLQKHRQVEQLGQPPALMSFNIGKSSLYNKR